MGLFGECADRKGGVRLRENQRKTRARLGLDICPGALFTGHRLPATMGSKFRAYPTIQEFAQISNLGLNIQAPYSVDGMNRSSLTASNLNPPRSSRSWPDRSQSLRGAWASPRK